jgi:glycogen debranching enzyme
MARKSTPRPSGEAGTAIANLPLVELRPRAGTNYLSSGATVLATREDGVLFGAPDHGLFVQETRLLSRYRWLIDGAEPHAVSASNVEQRSWLGYFIVAGRRDEAAKATISEAAQQAVELRLSRYVGGGVHEDVDLTNFTRQAVALTLELELASDFADQAETDSERRQRGRVTSVWAPGDGQWELRTSYEAEHRYAHQGETGLARIRRGLVVRFHNADGPPRRAGERIRFEVSLPPRGVWHCCVDLEPVIEDRVLAPHFRCRSFGPQPNEYDRKSRIFLQESTRFASRESDTLAGAVVGALEQGRRDLAALRLFGFDCGERAWTVAAGLPLYVALFGRDTLTAAWEAAPVTTGLMQGVLPVLARSQGREVNDWRDEQPGRMLHEAHSGPLAALNFTPQGRNYGSVTTSGFYPFVLAQLWHWTGDKRLVRPYLDPALRALEWLDAWSDRDRDGFYEYKTRSTDGLENQGWKDSGDALVHEDGAPVAAPIATCEEQGIAYAAKLNLAEVLVWFDRLEEAKRLRDEAVELKARFNEAFWMEDEGFFAMALDRDRRQVRSIGSNALHCVATGIADTSLVPRVLDRLFREDLFSGWGVRTLSAEHPAYNPYAYHRGTVWPVEHGPFAVGAYRYGLHQEVERICRAQFELAALFQHRRLPECIAGHPRDVDHPFPAVYPAANSPQAWSTTTVYTLLQAMLGMQPFAPLSLLFIDPQLPPWLPEISIRDMRVGKAVVSLRFFRKPDGRSDYEVLDKRGRLFVIRQPSPWSLTADLAERGLDVLRSLAR